MSVFENVGEMLLPFAPFLAVVAAVFLSLWAIHWILLRRSLTLEHEHRLPRQLALLGLSCLGLFAAILAMPVSDATRNQLLTVLGLLASGIIALSSTTLVANAMSGLMLRSTKSFRTGDFIRVVSHFGRVTERGLFDTEIQTEERELTALPNLFLITNPVTVVRSSGTLVSVSLSLGYDVPHAVVEPLLLEAAQQADLEEPFVRVMELGNFAVTYRVSGFLADIKNLLTARSNLCKMVLNLLHGNGIEIVSPSFMNQRPLPPDRRIIPELRAEVAPTEEQPAPEDLMFDKAESAERIEQQKRSLQSKIDEIETRLKQSNGDDRDRLKDELARLRTQFNALEKAPANESVVETK